jgi:ATP-dependent DNA helicase PIF1
MRLQTAAASSNAQEIQEFAKWILKVGEGKISEPNDGFADIEIPSDLLIPTTDNPIKSIVESTYPDLMQKYKQPDFLQSRAILASTIEVVDQINNYVLDLIPGNYILKLSFTFVSIII